MKSLQTIQKTFRAFQTLVRIAMVASFVWAGLSVLGLLCAFAWHSGVTVVGLSREALLALTLTGSLSQMVGVLLADAAFALTDGVLLPSGISKRSRRPARPLPVTARTRSGHWAFGPSCCFWRRLFFPH
ncbi:MAG: hypothetical protein J6J81_05845 [Oscillospiraceae bacterium]|nr:hypothetical protein [Oscillospiraceae bacterium]